jgi:hypothetical protein
MRKWVSAIPAYALMATMVVLCACNNASGNQVDNSLSSPTPASTSTSPVPPPTTTVSKSVITGVSPKPSPTTSPTVPVTILPTTGSTGVSPVPSTSATTIPPTTATAHNPPIRVVLDRIGVHDNGESGIRDPLGTNNGEIEVGIVVTDGISTVKKVFPAQGHYSLKEDATVDVNATVFETAIVGDSLRIMVTAYEDDGGLGEQVLYEALEFAIKMYIGPSATYALTLSGIDLSEEIGGLFGEESDWLGTYDKEWASLENWGVGRYVDVQCPIGDGKIGLRLWFTVE